MSIKQYIAFALVTMSTACGGSAVDPHPAGGGPGEGTAGSENTIPSSGGAGLAGGSPSSPEGGAAGEGGAINIASGGSRPEAGRGEASLAGGAGVSGAASGGAPSEGGENGRGGSPGAGMSGSEASPAGAGGDGNPSAGSGSEAGSVMTGSGGGSAGMHATCESVLAYPVCGQTEVNLACKDMQPDVFASIFSSHYMTEKPYTLIWDKSWVSGFPYCAGDQVVVPDIMPGGYSVRAWQCTDSAKCSITEPGWSGANRASMKPGTPLPDGTGSTGIWRQTYGVWCRKTPLPDYLACPATSL